jgi:hypothetical protein
MAREETPMIRRTYPSLLWFGAVVALLLFPLSVQADDIEPEPYFEEEVEPEPEPEPVVEEEPKSVVTRDEPSFSSKLFDCTVLRPFGFVGVLVGGALMVPATVLAAPGGVENIEAAYDAFLVSQVDFTFRRPLGEF